MKRPETKTYNSVHYYSIAQDKYIDQLEAENNELKNLLKKSIMVNKLINPK